MVVDRDLHSNVLKKALARPRAWKRPLHPGLGKDCIAANGFGKDLSCAANGLGKGHVHR